MTNTKTIQKNIQTAENTKPTNAERKQISAFKNLVNLSTKTDNELSKLNLTKSKLCDDITHLYIDMDISKFESKQIQDYQENNYFIKKKGVKNDKTAKPLVGTFKTVISAIKSFIKDGQIITKSTTYKDIRKHQNQKNAIILSEKRKEYNKRLATLSDTDIKQLIALFDSQTQK